MTNEEKVLYLANCVLIAGVNGEISPLEGEAIEGIREEIGASKDDLSKALNAVAQGNHQVTPVGRFSDKVRNLEDMIYLSISDGELSKSEKPEIISFAKATKISQNQLNEIFSESKLRTKLKKTPMICSSCGKNIPPESKFCPLCGEKVQ